MHRVYKSVGSITPCLGGIQSFKTSLYRFTSDNTQISQDKDNPCWIRTISYEASEGKLKNLYDRIKGADDNIDNIMLSHSLRPHTLEAHMHSLMDYIYIFVFCLSLYFKYEIYSV